MFFLSLRQLKLAFNGESFTNFLQKIKEITLRVGVTKQHIIPIFLLEQIGKHFCAVHSVLRMLLSKIRILS